LYVYDLCPFCTRARMIFGLKNIPLRLIWLSYADADTPTALIGKKMAPILHLHQDKPMGESLDIVRRMDLDPTWGPGLLLPASGREDLKEFEQVNWPLMRLLLHTRFTRVYLPELALKGGRDYFVNQHPVEGPAGEPRPDAAVWKSWDQAKQLSWYDHHYTNSEPLIARLNKALQALETLIHSEESVSHGGVSYDDVLLFCRLRPIHIIKGVELGPKAAAYLQRMSTRTNIPLLESMAI